MLSLVSPESNCPLEEFNTTIVLPDHEVPDLEFGILDYQPANRKLIHLFSVMFFLSLGVSMAVVYGVKFYWSHIKKNMDEDECYEYRPTTTASSEIPENEDSRNTSEGKASSITTAPKVSHRAKGTKSEAETTNDLKTLQPTVKKDGPPLGNSFGDAAYQDKAKMKLRVETK